MPPPWASSAWSSSDASVARRLRSVLIVAAATVSAAFVGGFVQRRAIFPRRVPAEFIPFTANCTAWRRKAPGGAARARLEPEAFNMLR
mmetsp:Transcript_45058/g.130109  ORF Transcript_45058/g.130109 Transcript_45058/m.130109 type:complete len:88 (-) Transcript_45058:7-270(-)